MAWPGRSFCASNFDRIRLDESSTDVAIVNMVILVLCS
jgi:hypothetical protein